MKKFFLKHLNNIMYFFSSILYSISLPSTGNPTEDILTCGGFIILFILIFYLNSKKIKKIENINCLIIASMSGYLLYTVAPLKGTLIYSFCPYFYFYIEKIYHPLLISAIYLIIYDNKTSNTN